MIHDQRSSNAFAALSQMLGLNQRFPSFIELQSDYFNKGTLIQFWAALISLYASEVDVNLNTETAILEGIVKGWDQGKALNKMGVRINAYETMIFWDKFSESAASDEQYENLINDEATSILKSVESQRPNEIIVGKYTLDNSSVDLDLPFR